MDLPSSITSRLALPLIAAPMLHVSGPDLVSAACRNGVIGAFPTINARSADELDAWLDQIAENRAREERLAAPVCPNVIMRRRPEMLAQDVAVLAKHRVELVITSVGSPATVVEPLHDIGCLVFADVASMHHAEKALEAGADGLVLLSAGAGGQTGWANGLAFVRAVRAMFDGPIVLAGGISDGSALWAAEVAGCNFGMMGTPFIATTESMAANAYKAMLVMSRLDDVITTQAFTGLDANILRPSIEACGLDPAGLTGRISPERARELFSAHADSARPGPKRWLDIWSAGHTVSSINQIDTTAALIQRIATEYEAVRRATAHRLAAAGIRS